MIPFDAGVLYGVPMLVERYLEFSYMQSMDLPFSMPFFALQNRISASIFGAAMFSGSASYMGTKRGIGNHYAPILQLLIHHFHTNMLPGMRVLTGVCVAWARHLSGRVPTCGESGGQRLDLGVQGLTDRGVAHVLQGLGWGRTGPWIPAQWSVSRVSKYAHRLLRLT